MTASAQKLALQCGSRVRWLGFRATVIFQCGRGKPEQLFDYHALEYAPREICKADA
jgi:hypothetical protein